MASAFTSVKRIKSDNRELESVSIVSHDFCITFMVHFLPTTQQFINTRPVMDATETEELEKIRQKAMGEVKSALQALENKFPGITEGAAALAGSGVGAAASFGALYTLGTTGVSAAGITSGLATAGSIVGGGMVAGIAVLAAPVAVLGIGGYAVVKHRKNARLTAALSQAIQKLYEVQERLMSNAEYFKAEIAGIKATIDMLTKKAPKGSLVAAR
ncbi:hypothetical protein [Klebsiella quasivariicola]|uniref:hypothetical protein n=1 Tax=Klebsiella quasivariicola TaxID=2026240 RepID=UPI002478DA60|nr:hypothetical protein [Klebsiella quasivariicola]